MISCRQWENALGLEAALLFATYEWVSEEICEELYENEKGRST